MTAIIINANPFGSLSEKRLNEFETYKKVHLPAEYRDFLLKFNGGQPVPSFFWIKLGEDGSSIFQFYGLHDGPSHLSISTYIENEKHGVPKSMLPIADDGTGNFICLGISSFNDAELFFIDHDVHPFYQPNSLKGITKIASSFSEFLLMLRESPE